MKTTSCSIVYLYLSITLISTWMCRAFGDETKEVEIAILDYQKDGLVCEYASGDFLKLPSFPPEEKNILYKFAYENAISNFARVSRWPTADEIKVSAATPSEFEGSLPGFVAWVSRIINADYIPEDLTNKVFGLTKWWEGHADTLFAAYSIKGNEFRILDTPEIMIATILGDDFSGKVADWRMFVDGTCIGFMARPARLRSYGQMIVAKLSATDIAKVNLSKWPRLDDEADNTEIWCVGNPEIWISKGAMRVEVRKLTHESIPLDKEYGIRQRFPPLKERLKDASVDEILAFIDDDKPSQEISVALGLLRQREDADKHVEPLIDVYRRVYKSQTRWNLAQALEGIAEKFGGPSAKKVEEFIRGEIASKPGGILQDVLEKVLSNVKKKIESEAVDKEDKKADASSP